MSELLQGEIERYRRHLVLEGFGKEAQIKLKNAKALVVGAGGLGCPVLSYLTAAGVGTIGIIDGDVVSESNLHRQVLYSTNDVGINKCIIASQKLKEQNPFITIEIYPELLDKTNALTVIKTYDLVIDCSDNFATRYLINDACVILNKPFVYGAIYKYEGQVSVFNFNDGPTYRCLFNEPPISIENLNCNEIGVLGVLPGIIGNFQASEALKIISGLGTPLAGKLFSINILNMQTSILDFTLNNKNKKITELGQYEVNCRIRELPFEQLDYIKSKENFQLIDVREQEEYVLANFKGKNIPLSNLSTRLNEIDQNAFTVVHCKSGVRSTKAIEIILKAYPNIEIYNLTGYNL